MRREDWPAVERETSQQTLAPSILMRNLGTYHGTEIEIEIERLSSPRPENMVARRILNDQNDQIWCEVS